MGSLRDLDIDVDLEVDGASELAALNAEINALVAMLGGLDPTIDINADLDDARLLTRLQDLQRQIDVVDANNIDIDINAEFASTLAQLQALETQVNALDRDDVFIDVDIGNMTGEILALRTQLRLLESQAGNVDVDLDTAAAHAQLAALQAHVQTLQMQSASMRLSSGVMGMLSSLNPMGLAVGAASFLAVMSALLMILPPLAAAINVVIGVVGVLGVALGVLGGAALALGSAFVVGGAGLLGFGAVAMSSITALYDENAKLTASQKELKAETDKVVDSWGGLKRALEPTVFDAAKSGVQAVNTLLDQGQPIIKKAGSAVASLMDNFNKSLKGSDMQSFFDMFKRDIGPITTNLGNGFGNALKGVANTMTALAPLTRWVSQGFENMMGRFGDWTSGLIGSNKMATFIDYIKTNAPKIGSALGDATKGVTKFIAGFSGLGADGFTWFQDKMSQFNNWASNLGDNAGFQNLLSGIKENAPIVGSILKDLGGSLQTFWTVMTDDSGGTSRLESFAAGIKGLSSALKDQNLQDVISGAFTFDLSKIVSGLTGGATNGGFGAAEAQIEKNVSETLKGGILKGITNAVTNITPTGTIGNVINSMITKLLGGDGGTSEPLPPAVIDNMVQGAMNQVESALNGSGVNSPYSKELGLFNGTEVKLDVGANTTPAETAIDGVTQGKEIEAKVNADTSKAEQQLDKVGSAKDIQAKVDADTAAAQSKLNALDATPIKIKTDTSAISAQIGSMAATIQLNANTSAIRNEIQNMPGANIKLSADTASLQNSISNLDASVTLKAKKIDITNNIVQPVNLPITPIMQKTDHLFGGAPATMEVTPKITKMPKIDPVTVDVKLNVNNSALGNLSAGIKVTFPPMPKFTWPSMPKFSWPPLPKFSWPPMPKFSWPPLPKWSWPAYPKFSWPPFPKFSWPPMPTVKVNVSGAANGSHASGLGRVPFDNYVGNLHKDESVLTAAQSDQLRSIGALKGDGESPDLDMSAIANYNPASASSNPKASVARTSNSKTSNTTNHYTINVQVDGSKSPEQTGASVVEQLQNWVASMEDANPAVYEF